MTVCLLTIDPQVDFCEGGALPVKGATDDLKRLATMIDKHGDALDDIQITMDSHYLMHISQPNFWMDASGKSPNPFTPISVSDVETGVWRPRNSGWKDWSINYVKELEANTRYNLFIWNPHCIIGTPGQCIQADFLRAITDWENKYYAMAPRTTKGSNPFTEHYSAVKADVPYPKDPGTRLNGRFIDTLKTYDIILISGEALSHCVANTIKDTAMDFTEDQIKKFVLLEDASTSVGGFEKLGEDFVNEMVGKGMQLSKTTEFFK